MEHPYVNLQHEDAPFLFNLLIISLYYENK
jgi:hypothetical protein